MRFGLSMIVKDEENTLAACLDAMLGACADVAVVDTGSTDRSLEVLARYGITPLILPMDAALCNSKAPARNLAFASVNAPWILSLDADERIDARGLARIAALPEDGPDGYFCTWNTYRDGTVVEDYKLALFRKGSMRSSGCAHETVQDSARKQGASALWLDGVAISHHPEPRKDAFKKVFYRERLNCGIARDPEWYRYYWFLGYKLYGEGDIEAAVRQFEIAARSASRRFPVECLNSRMLLAEIHARRGERARVKEILAGMRVFLRENAGDFEVKVNFRLGPWIEQASAHETAGRLDEIRAYRFPY